MLRIILFTIILLAHSTELAHAELISTAIMLTALIEGIIGGTAIVIGATTITAAAIGGFIVTGVALAAINVAATMLLRPKAPSLSGLNEFGTQDGVSQLRTASRVAITSRSVVMGKVLKAGTLFFERVRGPYLYRGYILANHEIDGVDEVRIGTAVLSLDPSTGRADAAPYFDGTTCFLQVSIRTGTDTQLLDPILDADFPGLEVAFRQLGMATAVVKLYRGSSSTVASSIWGQNDPAFLFLVRGKKFFDPRDPSQVSSDSTTWTFSRNAAINSAGWLNDPDGGNVDWAFIDTDYLAVAANVCDESILRLDGTSEPRYCLDGVADTANDPNSVLTDLMASMIGEYTYIDGKYAMVAGAPREAFRTLTEDSARGSLDVTTERPWSDYVNSVSTSFVAKNRDYQVATGPVYNDTDAIAEDGTEKTVTVQLPFVVSDTQVQRICKYIIRRSQLGGTIQRGENIEAMRLNPTDIVRLEYTGGLASLSQNWELVRLTEADRMDEYVLQLAQYDGDFLFGWNASTDERDWSQTTLNLN